MLTGQYDVGLDEGRFIIPSRLREQVSAVWPLEVAMFRWSECMFFVSGAPDPLENAIDCLGPTETGRLESREIQRAVASRLVVDVIDKRGRLRVPREDLAALGIGSSAVLVGAADHLELWNSERWRGRPVSSELAESLKI